MKREEEKISSVWVIFWRHHFRLFQLIITWSDLNFCCSSFLISMSSCWILFPGFADIHFFPPFVHIISFYSVLASHVISTLDKQQRRSDTRNRSMIPFLLVNPPSPFSFWWSSWCFLFRVLSMYFFDINNKRREERGGSKKVQNPKTLEKGK